MGISPSRSHEPSARCSAQLSSSSGEVNSPVMASSRSCSVTRPWTSPYSSSTRAICVLELRMFSSSSMPVRVSGTYSTSCRFCEKSMLSPRSDCASSCLVWMMPRTSSRPPRHTGKRECSYSATFCRFSSCGSSTSRNTTSLRGTISEEIWRSSRRNTLRTMTCSLCSMTPDSEPSASSAWISSSVTFCSVSGSTPMLRRIRLVEPVSAITNGRETSDRTPMGRAASRATVSALIWPRRLGTSSPTTMAT